MKRRALGRSGLSVPAVGMGTWFGHDERRHVLGLVRELIGA